MNMTHARQLFSTKLAWDERLTQHHAVNTIKEVFNCPLWPLATELESCNSAVMMTAPPLLLMLLYFVTVLSEYHQLN